MNPTIGLPRLFCRHEYPGLWEDFFQRLGLRVIISRPTEKNIFDAGIRMCTGDVCLPIKVLHGHVGNLQETTDAVFVPRFVYPAPKESSCPKFCALPDMLKHNLADPPIIEMTMDLNKGLPYTLSTLDTLASFLSRPRAEVRRAFMEAMTHPDTPWYCQQFSRASRPSAETASPLVAAPSAAENGVPARPAIGLIGHTYLLRDRFLTMNLQNKIEKRGYMVLTGDSIAYDLKRKRCAPFQNRTFWGVGVDMLGTALTLMQDRQVRGLIYVTSFACGIDSVVLELLDRYAEKIQAQPHMRLCLDEHTGESGFDTRLEAFFDLLERQNTFA